MRFDKDFLIGAATAAHQVGGNNTNSDCWALEHMSNSNYAEQRKTIAPDKLYMSWLVYDSNAVKLSTLIQGQDCYVCVDSFHENGITPGVVCKL